MKKLVGLGKILDKPQMKMITGGYGCTSTCWFQSSGGPECSSVTVPNCDGSNASACRTGDCSDVPKATCSCDD